VRCNIVTSTDYEIKARVALLGPTVYLIYTANIPTYSRLTVSTFADYTAYLSRSRIPIQTTAQLALHLIDIKKGFSDWWIKVNDKKCKHVTFTPNRQNCPPHLVNNIPLPKADEVTYLGVNLDRRITIFTIKIWLNIPPVINAITELMEKYHSKLSSHPNHLARNFTQLSSRSRLF